MKILELNLQKKLLIVEVPKLSDYEFINKDSKYLKIGNEEIKLNIPTLSKLELICKGSELTEEIAKELVRNGKINEFNIYFDYKKNCWLYENKTTIDSFISAIEAQGYYWGENTIKEPIENDYNLGDIHSGFFHKKYNEWQEAESKTFNLSKTLIFEIL